MSTLLLLQGYNNYFNRTVKFYNTVAEYKAYTYHEVEANFNPNDGVDTEHVFNAADINPDYLVVYEDNTIKSRWFVQEWQRTRAGQYKCSLKRDVKADLYNFYINAPAYIERAMVDVNNPMIYNAEGGSYNQIKKSETLLNYGNGKRWIVGYLSKTAGELSYAIGEDGTYIEINTAIADWKYYGYSTNPYVGAVQQAEYKSEIQVPKSGNYQFICYKNGNNTYTEIYSPVQPLVSTKSLLWTMQSMASVYTTYTVAPLNTALATEISAHTASDEDELLGYQGKLIKDINNKVYRLTYSKAVQSVTSRNLTSVEAIQKQLAASADCFKATQNMDSYAVTYSVNTYLIALEEVGTGSGTTSQTRWKCSDSPLYDMFAIPYDPVFVTGEKNTSKDASIKLAVSLASTATGSKCFDVQLLPYCPVQEYLIGAGSLLLPAADSNKGWQKVKDANNNFLTVILYPTQSNVSFTIAQSLEAKATALEKKVANECDMYRLCSPNGQGAFEFSVEKNGGVPYFDVDITYKPYNPYIHIAPHFAGMYGADFNDFRGLTCGGDFSFGTLNDAWANYELSNKNYQAIFNREIENMDLNYKYQMAESGLSSVVSAAGIGAGVAKLGNKGLGIAAGGVSLAAGIADQVIAAKKYDETVDFKKDMFDFQHGNIKALPLTISKTSALVSNTKESPYIEYYTATDVEKQSLRNNITYSSMKIGINSTINTFLNGTEQFVKAVLIKLPDIVEDTHMAQELYMELAKGAYFV